MIGKFTLVIIAGIAPDIYPLGLRTTIHDGWLTEDDVLNQVREDLLGDAECDRLIDALDLISHDQNGDDISCLIEHRDGDGELKNYFDFASYYPEEEEEE